MRYAHPLTRTHFGRYLSRHCLDRHLGPSIPHLPTHQSMQTQTRTVVNLSDIFQRGGVAHRETVSQKVEKRVRAESDFQNRLILGYILLGSIFFGCMHQCWHQMPDLSCPKWQLCRRTQMAHGSSWQTTR